MKSIIQSHTSQEIDRIIAGKQTVKICRTAPKDTPFKVYMYMIAFKERFPLWEYATSYMNSKGKIIDGSQKVVGEYLCKQKEVICNVATTDWKLLSGDVHERHKRFVIEAGFSEQEIHTYSKGRFISCLHFSDLKIYDKPKDLHDFYRPCVDKYEYCEACQYSCVSFPPDEEEYALYHGGRYEYFEFICKNILTSPPHGWKYVQPLKNNCGQPQK